MQQYTLPGGFRMNIIWRVLICTPKPVVCLGRRSLLVELPATLSLRLIQCNQGALAQHQPRWMQLGNQ